MNGMSYSSPTPRRRRPRSPALNTARAYYRLAAKRTTSPRQAEIYRKIADALVERNRRETLDRRSRLR